MRTKNLTRLPQERGSASQGGTVLGGLLVLLVALAVILGLLLAVAPTALAEVPRTGPVSTTAVRCRPATTTGRHHVRAVRCRVAQLSLRGRR